eukprot:3514072-Amphidinium_carterae.1
MDQVSIDRAVIPTVLIHVSTIVMRISHTVLRSVLMIRRTSGAMFNQTSELMSLVGATQS